MTTNTPVTGELPITATDSHVEECKGREGPLPIRVRPLLGVTAVLWMAAIPLLRVSSDWHAWLSLPSGVSGWIAGLVSTSLAIVFSSQLFQSGHQIASAASFSPLSKQLKGLLCRIRKSRIPVSIASLSAVVAGAFLFRFWVLGDAGFPSINWFATALPAVCGCAFSLTYLISCSVGCIIGLLRSAVVDDSLDLLLAEPENSIRAISRVVTLALTKSVLAAAPWTYHLLLLRTYGTEKSALLVAVAGSLIAIIVFAYFAYLSRTRNALIAGQDEARIEVHRKWQDVMCGAMLLGPEEHAKLEAVALLREHIRQSPRWSLEYSGLARVGTALLVAVAPVVIAKFL